MSALPNFQALICSDSQHYTRSALGQRPTCVRSAVDCGLLLSEFRNLAWAAANDTARQFGWIKSCDELHGAAELAGPR